MSSDQINQEALREQYRALSVAHFTKKQYSIWLGAQRPD